MNYKDYTLGDWIGHINGIIEDETTLDGNEMRDLVEFLTTMQEPCGDTISRTEALKQAKEWRDNEFLRVTNPYYYLEKRLNNLPPVALQETKTGYWIVREDSTSYVRQFPRKWVECSHCHWSFSYDRIKDNYCSNCGAKMSEVSE